MSRRPVLAALLLLTSCWRDRAAGPAGPVGGTPIASEACGPDDLSAPVTDANPEGRLRGHVTGSLAGRDARTWAGIPVPAFIPRTEGTLELMVLDRADGGHLALYRDPYDVGTCSVQGATNCGYAVRHYNARGQLQWAFRLNDVLSRPDHLEVQDIRLAGGILYVNEACQGYARAAGGQCSSLIAIEASTPAGPQVQWRTPPLTSNGRFAVRGCYLVAGYGFTAELDALSLISRATGQVVARQLVSSAPQRLTLTAPDALTVELYSGALRRFRLDGMGGEGGRLVPLDPPEAGFGGGAYGGGAYGGSLYGGGGPNR